MSKKRKHSKKESGSSPQPAAAGRGGTDKPRRRSWLATHGRDLKFIGIFVAVLVVYWWVSTTAVATDKFFPWYLRVNASGAGWVLNTMGWDEVTVDGQAMLSPPPQRFAMQIERGCDAVEPSVLFLAAVLASPVAFLRKIPAVIVGTILLMFLNFFRLVTLFLTGLYWKEVFDMMHLNVWQAAFIIMALFFWLIWVTRVTRRPVPQANASD